MKDHSLIHLKIKNDALKNRKIRDEKAGCQCCEGCTQEEEKPCGNNETQTQTGYFASEAESRFGQD